jgi:FlaA1/EpsC-like NDP-sugar epimerase
VAVILGVVSTLYVDAYHASPEEQAVGAYQVSRIVWAMFLVINIALTFGLRELVRELLERRWKAGLGLKRILIAGAGDLGRVVAEKILQHGELGYQVMDSSTIAPAAIIWGIEACRCSALWRTRRNRSGQEHIDHLYVALPLEEHIKMLDVIESTIREMVDVKVGPDLVSSSPARAARRSGRRSDHQHSRRPRCRA